MLVKWFSLMLRTRRQELLALRVTGMPLDLGLHGIHVSSTKGTE